MSAVLSKVVLVASEREIVRTSVRALPNDVGPTRPTIVNTDTS